MSWIAFDEVTHDALNRLREEGDEVGFSSDDALDYAFRSQKSSVVLLPSGDEVVLLTIKHNVIPRDVRPEEIALRPQPESESSQPEPEPFQPDPSEPEPSHPEAEAGIHYVGGGFLGLSDEVALDEEPKQRKSWWKRFLN